MKNPVLQGKLYKRITLTGSYSRP